MKYCLKCDTDKELDCFFKDKKSKDGFQSWCKLCKSKSISKYYEDNPTKKSKKSGKRTKEQGRERYYRNRISFNMSRMVRASLSSGKDGCSWEKLVGYNLSDLKNHLELLFKDGMSWDNYGKWHIDHKKPVSKFNIVSSECDDFKICWSLNNLQPLWSGDNIRKSNKY